MDALTEIGTSKWPPGGYFSMKMIHIFLQTFTDSFEIWCASNYGV
jgi:hypothetical protein